jgi:hypothetical protein
MIGKRIAVMAARSDEDSDDGTVAMSLWDAPLPLPHLSFVHSLMIHMHPIYDTFNTYDLCLLLLYLQQCNDVNKTNH